jgi:hypothetical protein
MTNIQDKNITPQPTVTPQEWSKLLEKATEKGKYVVLTDKGKYEIKERAKLDSTATKLSIAQIQQISQEKIKELKGQYLKGPLTGQKIRDFEGLATDITSKTLELIEARQAKSDRLVNKLLRGAAKLSIIGNLFLGKINKEREEMRQWKENISKTRGSIDELREEKLNRDRQLLVEEFGYPEFNVGGVSSLLQPDYTVYASDILRVKERIPQLIDRLQDLKPKIEKIKNKPEQIEREFEQTKSEQAKILDKIKKTEGHLKRLEKQRASAKKEKKSHLTLQIQTHEERLIELKKSQAQIAKKLKELQQVKEEVEPLKQFNQAKEDLKSYIEDITQNQKKYQTSFTTASELTALVKVHKHAERDVELLATAPFRYSPEEIHQILTVQKGKIPHFLGQIRQALSVSEGKPLSQATYPLAYQAFQEASRQLQGYIQEAKKIEEDYRTDFQTANHTLIYREKKKLLEEMGYASELADEILSLEEQVPSLLDNLHLLSLQLAHASPEEKGKLTKQWTEVRNQIKSYVDAVQFIQRQYSNLNLSLEGASHLTTLLENLSGPYIQMFQHPDFVKRIAEDYIIPQTESYWKDYAAEEPKPKIIHQFSKDIGRSQSFIRIDQDQNIRDQHPIPSDENRVHESRVQQGSNAIDKIVEINPEKNRRWAPILQMAVLQTNLNGAFGLPIYYLGTSCANVSWVEDGKDFALTTKFSERTPPAILEIIRNKDQEIESVHVSFTGQLNFVKKIEGGQESEKDGQVVIDNALNAKVSYKITLGEDGRPIFSDFKHEFHTSINPPIAPEKWAELLKQAAESQKGPAHQYIAIKDYQYVLGSANNKLSIRQIVDVSRQKLEELRKQLQDQKITEQAFIETATNITRYTEQLIEGREVKRDSTHLRVGRGAAKAAAIVLSIIGIGVPIFKRLRRKDEEFSSQQAELKGIITQERFVQSIKDAKKKTINTQLRQIPEYLQEWQKVTTADQLKFIQDKFLELLPKDAKARYVDQFSRDMIGRVSFQRKDEAAGIDDHTPQPPLELSTQERVESGAHLIEELLTQEGDERWKHALQLAATQTSLNAIFDPIMTLLNTKFISEMWKDPEDGKSYYLRAVFGEQLPSITLEVVRNPATRQIEKVKVSIAGNLDMRKFSDKNEQKEVVASNAVKGKISYSITLDKDNRPVVSDVQTDIETGNLAIAQPSSP